MRAILFFALLLFSETIISQNLKGKVVNSSGEPIAGSSVYIRENKQGLICNESGQFQIKLTPGTYNCEFSCLGYEMQEKQLSIRPGSDVTDIEVVLNEKNIELKEVLIDNSGEDPAYAIIRKAIEKAPYHELRIRSFSSEAYVKGGGKLLSIPKLLENLSGAKDEINMYKNKVFLQESFSEINFVAPDSYEQKVKAFSSTLPEDFDPEDAMGIVTVNLYNPMYGNYVSPLHPKSFSHYKFRYEGYDEQDGSIVNKIKVIPKMKNPRLVEGYIYIAEDTWDIRHADLIFRGNGVKRRNEITFNKVHDDIFMPVAYNIHMDIDLMGVKAYMDYLSSIKYTHVEVNDSLIKKEKTEKKKKSLEIKQDDKYKVISDSLSTKRDSLFWSEVRNVPLNVEEIQSYVRKDTMQALTDSLKREYLNPTFKWTDLINGGRFGGDSSRVYFKYEGLLGVFPEYNFVDGFWAGQKVELGIRRNKHSIWKIEPMAFWAWSRERLLWNIDVSYTYAPMRLGKFYMSGGSISEDYSGRAGMLRIENAVYSAVMGVNDARFYQKDYFNIGNEIDIANGFRLGLDVEIADRHKLENHTTYSLFGDKGDAELNIPEYAGDLNDQYNMLMKYGIHLTYTPEYYYSVTKSGRKIYEHTRFPTFGIIYQQGISSWLENSRFYRLDAKISQTLKPGIFDRLLYAVAAGKFFNDNSFNYIDYKHFDAAHQLITGKTFETSYSLLDYYTFSTNKNWLQAFVAYDTPYLVLKRLPFLQSKAFREAVHGKFLHTPDKEYYSEWGYSVGLPGLGSAGVFVAFDSFEYNSWGISFSLPLLREVGIKK